MSTRDQVTGMLTALLDVLGPVSPWSVALWLASTIVMACLLVLGWQHVVRR